MSSKEEVESLFLFSEKMLEKARLKGSDRNFINYLEGVVEAYRVVLKVYSRGKENKTS